MSFERSARNVSVSSAVTASPLLNLTLAAGPSQPDSLAALTTSSSGRATRLDIFAAVDGATYFVLNTARPCRKTSLPYSPIVVLSRRIPPLPATQFFNRGIVAKAFSSGAPSSLDTGSLIVSFRKSSSLFGGAPIGIAISGVSGAAAPSALSSTGRPSRVIGPAFTVGSIPVSAIV